MTATAIKEYADSTTLTWKYGGTYASWVTSAVSEAMGTDWSSATYNNTRMPTFSYSTSGAGTVTFSASAASPCSGSTEWLECSSNWGQTGWHIYIRDLVKAPHTTWAWYNTTGSCPSGKTCWLIQRALMHEIEHVTLGVTSHDAQGESNTVMAATTPWSPNSGWSTKHIQRCDEAAGQLLYDVANTAGPYADCYRAITGHGTNGLITTASVNLASYTACVGFNASTGGRIAVKTTTAYKRLSDNPLTGRKVWFDRKPSTGSTWTTNVHSTIATNASGTNWALSIPNPGSGNGVWNYRVHVAGETGLDASNQPTFSVTWTTSIDVC